jgi:hypothetical protein
LPPDITAQEAKELFDGIKQKLGMVAGEVKISKWLIEEVRKECQRTELQKPGLPKTPPPSAMKADKKNVEESKDDITKPATHGEDELVEEEDLADALDDKLMTQQPIQIQGSEKGK